MTDSPQLSTLKDVEAVLQEAVNARDDLRGRVVIHYGDESYTDDWGCRKRIGGLIDAYLNLPIHSSRGRKAFTSLLNAASRIIRSPLYTGERYRPRSAIIVAVALRCLRCGHDNPTERRASPPRHCASCGTVFEEVVS